MRPKRVTGWMPHVSAFGSPVSCSGSRATAGCVRLLDTEYNGSGPQLVPRLPLSVFLELPQIVKSSLGLGSSLVSGGILYLVDRRLSRCLMGSFLPF